MESLPASDLVSAGMLERWSASKSKHRFLSRFDGRQTTQVAASGTGTLEAPKARPEGSQGQVRSAAQHAASGSFREHDQPGTGDRHAAFPVSVGPPGLKFSLNDPGVTRAASRRAHPWLPSG